MVKFMDEGMVHGYVDSFDGDRCQELASLNVNGDEWFMRVIDGIYLSDPFGNQTWRTPEKFPHICVLKWKEHLFNWGFSSKPCLIT